MLGFFMSIAGIVMALVIPVAIGFGIWKVINAVMGK